MADLLFRHKKTTEEDHNPAPDYAAARQAKTPPQAPVSQASTANTNTDPGTKPAKATAEEQDLATKFHKELTAIIMSMEHDYGGVDGICNSNFKKAYGQLGMALEGLNEIVGDGDGDESEG